MNVISRVQIRGDPDGCGLDITGIRYSPTSELRVDLPAEDLLNIKKGWLMKQGLNKVRLVCRASQRAKRESPARVAQQFFFSSLSRNGTSTGLF